MKVRLGPSSLTPEKLGVVTVKPESLSIRGLTDYLDYLKANEQDPSRYLLAFWRKLIQPCNGSCNAFSCFVVYLWPASFSFYGRANYDGSFNWAVIPY